MDSGKSAGTGMRGDRFLLGIEKIAGIDRRQQSTVSRRMEMALFKPGPVIRPDHVMHSHRMKGPVSIRNALFPSYAACILTGKGCFSPVSNISFNPI